MDGPTYKSSLDDRVLTEAEQATFVIRSSVVHRIEAFRRARGLDKRDLRVLDWGCGRGRTVFALRELGYEAYGVEINQEPIESGRLLAQSRGLDAEKILTALDSEGRTSHPDQFFHFTLSTDVLEHVEDLQRVANELGRITAPGGGGIHLFPSQRLIVEPHLRIPFVHWLPKNQSRLALIRACVSLGVRTRSESEHEGHAAIRSAGLQGADRARFLYRFSCDRTFYRSPRAIRVAFEQAGLRAQFDPVHAPGVRNHRLVGPVARQTLLAPLLNWVLVHFWNLNLVLAKPAAGPRPRE